MSTVPSSWMHSRSSPAVQPSCTTWPLFHCGHGTAHRAAGLRAPHRDVPPGGVTPISEAPQDEGSSPRVCPSPVQGDRGHGAPGTPAPLPRPLSQPGGLPVPVPLPLPLYPAPGAPCTHRSRAAPPGTPGGAEAPLPPPGAGPDPHSPGCWRGAAPRPRRCPAAGGHRVTSPCGRCSGAELRATTGGPSAGGTPPVPPTPSGTPPVPMGPPYGAAATRQSRSSSRRPHSMAYSSDLLPGGHTGPVRVLRPPPAAPPPPPAAPHR